MIGTHHWGIGRTTTRCRDIAVTATDRGTRRGSSRGTTRNSGSSRGGTRNRVSSSGALSCWYW